MNGADMDAHVADAILCCHGLTLPVHRLVLACHSAPLQALVSLKEQELGLNKTFDDDCPAGPLLLDVTDWFPLAEEAKLLLDGLRYIYGHNLKLSVKRAGMMLRVACILHCVLLNRACQGYLALKLSIANSLWIWWQTAACRFPSTNRALERWAKAVAVYCFGDTLCRFGKLGRPLSESFSEPTLRWFFKHGLAHRKATCASLRDHCHGVGRWKQGRSGACTHRFSACPPGLPWKNRIETMTIFRATTWHVWCFPPAAWCFG